MKARNCGVRWRLLGGMAIACYGMQDALACGGMPGAPALGATGLKAWRYRLPSVGNMVGDAKQ